MIRDIITYLETINPILAALYATIFTWSVTALGAAVVFFFKKENKNGFGGFVRFYRRGVLASRGVGFVNTPIYYEGGS